VVVEGCHPAEILETAEHAFDGLSRPTEDGGKQFFQTRLPSGDVRQDAAGFDTSSECVRVGTPRRRRACAAGKRSISCLAAP
jgi:hypothetical protein